MWYYYVDYRGEAPALPEGVGFMLVAAPGHGFEWGLFNCGRELDPSETVHDVDDDTLQALYAAEHYPPALALARDEVAVEFDERAVTREAFAARYRERLRYHMRHQPDVDYVFVEAVGDELGYLTRGRFYWVLSYDPDSGLVRWVSSDYFVYQNPASDFALSESQLRALTPGVFPAPQN